MSVSATDIHSLSREDIAKFVADLGGKPYRAKQLWGCSWA